MPGSCRIGIAGWTYPPWRGVFYPKGLRQRDELSYASSQLDSIEVNGSFYALQKPASYRTWAEQTPDDFVFSLKAPRFITHLKKLRGVEIPLANFFASGPLVLGPKLGPILWQLPPTLGFEAQRLSDFFSLLPRSTHEAAYLARHHDDRVANDGLAAGEDRPLRHALEIRHASYRTPAFVELMREHQIATVVADTAGKWPLLRDVTSDFVYVRLHGDVELYTSGYSETALDGWAREVLAWRHSGLDVFVYFDNDVKVHSPFDAMALARRVALAG